MTYNQMLEWIEMDQDKDDFYRIEGIVNHRRNQKSPSWMGSSRRVGKWTGNMEQPDTHLSR